MDDEVSNFERKINFRFEEEGSSKIKTYERDIPDTMRKDKNKRADKRRERNERKKEEINEFKEEATMLKSIKKQELKDKINKLMEISGLRGNAKKELSNLMGDEYNQDRYEETMNKLFDEDYFDEEEEDEEALKKYVKDVERNYNKAIIGEKLDEIEVGKKDSKNKQTKDKENLLTPKSTIPIEFR